MAALVPIINLAQLQTVDFLAGPRNTDLSLATALLRAGDLAAKEARGVLVGLKPGMGGSYTFDELDIPPDVNLQAASIEVVELDGQFNFSDPGRRELRNIRIIQSTDKKCLDIAPSGSSVILLRGGLYRSREGASAGPCVDIQANGNLIGSDVEFRIGLSNPSPVLLLQAGSLSLQNNWFATHEDFTTPTLRVLGGSANLSRGAMWNPIDYQGGNLALETVLWDLFQLSPQDGTAITMSNGVNLILRNTVMINVDGQNNPVFKNGGGGGGTVFHDDVNIEHFEFTGAGTLFDAGISEVLLKERNSAVI